MTAAPRLAHVGLAVRDLDAMIAFFTDFLGFVLTKQMTPSDPGAIAGITGVDGAQADAIAYVARGDWVFELLHYTAPVPAPNTARPCDPGTFHWLIETDDFEKSLAQAAGYGFDAVSPAYPIAAGPNCGKRGTYLRHNDGFTLEVIG